MALMKMDSTITHLLQIKMKKVLLLMMVLATICVIGQNHLLGIKGGIGLTNISENNFPGDYSNRIGSMGGLTYEYLLSEQFSLGADLLFNQRGFRSYLIFTDDLGNPTGEKALFKDNYNYLSLPLKAGFKTNSKIYTFANIGLVPSVLTCAEIIQPQFDAALHVNGHETIEFTDRATKFDMAAMAEIGAGTKFKERYWMYASFGYQHSFTTITNDIYFTTSKIWHKGMTFSLGIMYALGNN